jgi:hypothetical protein
MLRSISTRFAGLVILLLGVWGGIIPFVGPYFHFTLGPDHTWTWTMSRLWLDVLPAIAAVIGGLWLIGAGPRLSGRLGAMLALLAGAWFAIGPALSMIWHAGGAAGIAHGSSTIQGLEILSFHTGLGVLVAALAGYALPALLRPGRVVSPAGGTLPPRRTVAGASATTAPAAAPEGEPVVTRRAAEASLPPREGA